MNAKGFFLAVEGIDGSGKDSLIKDLAGRILQSFPQREIFISRQPTYQTRTGQNINLYKTSGKDLSALEWTRLFIEDRLEYQSFLKALLSRGAIVIINRYDMSTFAYQGAMGLKFETILEEHQKEGNYLIPDVSLVLELSVETSLERIGQRGEQKEVFEKKSLLEGVASNYHRLIPWLSERQKREFLTVNAEKSLTKVSNEAWKKLLVILNKNIA